MKSFDKNNCYAYRTGDNTTSKGYFNIYQAKSGGIYIQMGITVTELTEKQITDLGLSVYELIDFSHDDYIKKYREDAPGLPNKVNPVVIHPILPENIQVIADREMKGATCTEEESAQIKRYIIENSDNIAVGTESNDNDKFLASVFPCEYSEAWQMIEEK